MAAKTLERPTQARTRVSVDLSAGDYDLLRNFAHTHRMKHVDVLRALLGLLDDTKVARRVSEFGGTS